VSGGIVSRWTGGRSATCLECATRFEGLVCPNCRQRLEARDLSGRIGVEVQTEAGDTWLVLAERNPDGGWDAPRSDLASDEAVRMLVRQHADPGPPRGLFDDGPEGA